MFRAISSRQQARLPNHTSRCHSTSKPVIRCMNRRSPTDERFLTIAQEIRKDLGLTGVISGPISLSDPELKKQYKSIREDLHYTGGVVDQL